MLPLQQRYDFERTAASCSFEAVEVHPLVFSYQSMHDSSTLDDYYYF